MKSIKDFFRKKESQEGKPKTGFVFFKKKPKKDEEKRTTYFERRHKLREYLDKSGVDINPQRLSRIIFNVCAAIDLLLSVYVIHYISKSPGEFISLSYILVILLVLWIPVLIIIWLLVWIIFYIILDLKIFRRKTEIEEVLPDFLQLTAANIKAGMTIDRALWYAVRPRFGVLAKEIEIVAKETMGGQDLKAALEKFANKYDSILLKRTVSLVVEGTNSGGEIGDLLNKIALNVEEINIRKKEMAGSVTTYIIFISFATVLAAPVLFSLSGLLISVVKNLSANISGIGSGAPSMGLAISFSGVGIEESDFKIFAVSSLAVTSFFSSAIIATIKKGSIKSGLKYIPMFIITSVTLFLILYHYMMKLSTIFF